MTRHDFVAVIVAVPSRWWLAGQAPPLDAVPVALAMVAGGMIGAAGAWLVVVFVPAGAIRVVLGSVLIASALRVFKA